MSGLRRKGRKHKKNKQKLPKYKHINYSPLNFATLMAPGIHQVFLNYLNSMLYSPGPFYNFKFQQHTHMDRMCIQPGQNLIFHTGNGPVVVENNTNDNVSVTVELGNLPPQQEQEKDITKTSSDVILLALAKQAGGSFKIDRKYFAEVLKELSGVKNQSVEVDTEQDDEFVHVRIK